MKNNQNNFKHPEAIFIQLHTHCNAKCINCPHEFTYGAIHPKGRMCEKTWQKILSDLQEMDFRGQVGFYLHHEPLIDTTLYDKIRDVNEKTNAFVVLSTNGYLLTEKNIEKLISAGPRKVHININSGDKAEYEHSMKLEYDQTITNARNFINCAKDKIDIEINCPVIEGYNVQKLREIFPDVKVNLDYWANSRGGLLPDFYHEDKGSRFKMDNYCKQPSVNFNILYDGSVIACCIDWLHESKKDFPNINDVGILTAYNEVMKLEEKFKEGDYSRYEMCKSCSKEMGFYQKEDNIRYKILLTNHQLLHNSGSEILTLTLARSLKKQNCDVTVYSKYLGELSVEFKNDGIEVVKDLKLIKDKKFDLAHVHHNINALEVRNTFPELPIIFFSQGVLPFLEQPPAIDINISHYLAISEEVKANLMKNGIAEEEISVIGNLIDSMKFFPKKQLNENVNNILVVSAKITEEKVNVIKEACKRLNINVRFVGGGFGEVKQEDLIQLIQESEIVISLGRGAIEAMLCGRVPIIFDYQGADGMVTPDTFDEIRKNNFSGRRYGLEYSPEDLINEIKKYKAEYGKILMRKAVENYSAAAVTKKLLKIYAKVLAAEKSANPVNEELLTAFCNTVNETRAYSIKVKDYEYSSKANLPPNVLKFFLEIAENLINKENYDDAKKLLIKLYHYKESAEVLIDLAVIEIILQNYNSAAQLLTRALILDPQNEAALENLYYLKDQLENKVNNYSSIEVSA